MQWTQVKNANYIKIPNGQQSFLLYKITCLKSSSLTGFLFFYFNITLKTSEATLALEITAALLTFPLTITLT